MLLPALSLDELRRRVREAESLLRVARQHVRDAHDDPAQSEHANARIQSICREVEELFPGLDQPVAPDPGMEETLDLLRASMPHGPEPEGEGAEEAGGVEEQEEEEEEGEGELEDEEEQEEEEEPEEDWHVDHVKLAAAIENEALMSQLPEPGRSAFRRAAKYLVESLVRQELFARVVAAFEELSGLTQQNLDEIHRKLALALTLEELALKRRG